jgi:hypothetical protein
MSSARRVHDHRDAGGLAFGGGMLGVIAGAGMFAAVLAFVLRRRRAAR